MGSSKSSGADFGVRAPAWTRVRRLTLATRFLLLGARLCHSAVLSVFSDLSCSSIPLTLKQTGTAAVNQYKPKGVEGGWGAAG